MPIGLSKWKISGRQAASQATVPDSELFLNLYSAQNTSNSKMYLKTPGLGCFLFLYKAEKSLINSITQGVQKSMFSTGFLSVSGHAEKQRSEI